MVASLPVSGFFKAPTHGWTWQHLFILLNLLMLGIIAVLARCAFGIETSFPVYSIHFFSKSDTKALQALGVSRVLDIPANPGHMRSLNGQFNSQTFTQRQDSNKTKLSNHNVFQGLKKIDVRHRSVTEKDIDDYGSDDQHQNDRQNNSTSSTRPLLDQNTTGARVGLQYNTDRVPTSPDVQPLVYRHCNSTDCIYGKAEFNQSLLSTYGISALGSRSFPRLNLGIAQKFVFVTACSAGHFKEDMDAIAGIIHHFPKRKVIVYDIGLRPKQLVLVHQLCSVEYRYFNFSQYPEHVSKLGKFAWKMMIFKEVLQTEQGIFWVDSSVRFNSNNLTSLYSGLVKNDGVMIVHRGMTMIHPRMLEYVPLDMGLFRKRFSGQAGAGGAGLYFRTRRNYETLFKWLFLCALTPDCIAPKGGQPFCPKQKPPKCYQHRFDQALLNALLALRFDMQPRTYFREEHLVGIKRKVTGIYLLGLCDSESNTPVKLLNTTRLP